MIYSDGQQEEWSHLEECAKRWCDRQGLEFSEVDFVAAVPGATAGTRSEAVIKKRLEETIRECARRKQPIVLLVPHRVLGTVLAGEAGRLAAAAQLADAPFVVLGYEELLLPARAAAKEALLSSVWTAEASELLEKYPSSELAHGSAAAGNLGEVATQLSEPLFLARLKRFRQRLKVCSFGSRKEATEIRIFLLDNVVYENKDGDRLHIIEQAVRELLGPEIVPQSLSTRVDQVQKGRRTDVGKWISPSGTTVEGSGTDQAHPCFLAELIDESINILYPKAKDGSRNDPYDLILVDYLLGPSWPWGTALDFLYGLYKFHCECVRSPFEPVPIGIVTQDPEAVDALVRSGIVPESLGKRFRVHTIGNEKSAAAQWKARLLQLLEYVLLDDDYVLDLAQALSRLSSLDMKRFLDNLHKGDPAQLPSLEVEELIATIVALVRHWRRREADGKFVGVFQLELYSYIHTCLLDLVEVPPWSWRTLRASSERLKENLRMFSENLKAIEGVEGQYKRPERESESASREFLDALQRILELYEIQYG